ncbi:MAG: hypothetical protein KJ623_03545 [Nanoarchaeota archaeon]|nr:hypothetical protein [Nanoarchaeota archaeon]MBU0963358.1 hypothetical protein [Nanoarchaeota archaeon]
MSDVRTKYMEFVRAMVEKSQKKEESKPNDVNSVDVKEIEKLTEKLREEIPDKLKKKN